MVRPGSFRAEIIRAADTDAQSPMAVVQAWGELDGATAPQLNEVIERASGPGVRVVVELSTVTFIDSSGVGTLVRARRRATAHDGGLAVRNPSPMARRIFEILGLNGTLPIEEGSPWP